MSKKSFRHAFDQNDVLIEGKFALGCAHAKGAHLPNRSAKTKAHVLGFCEFYFIFPPAGGKTLRGPLTAAAFASSSRWFIDSLKRGRQPCRVNSSFTKTSLEFSCIRPCISHILGRKGGDCMKHEIPDLDDFIFAEEEYAVSQR